MEVARDEAVGVDNLAQRKPATHVWLGCKRRIARIERNVVMSATWRRLSQLSDEEACACRYRCQGEKTESKLFEHRAVPGVLRIDCNQMLEASVCCCH